MERRKGEGKDRREAWPNRGAVKQKRKAERSEMGRWDWEAGNG